MLSDALQYWVFVAGVDYDLSDMDTGEAVEILEDLPINILFKINQDQLLEYFADPDEWIAEQITDNTNYLINGAKSHHYVGEVDELVDEQELLESLILESYEDWRDK